MLTDVLDECRAENARLTAQLDTLRADFAEQCEAGNKQNSYVEQLEADYAKLEAALADVLKERDEARQRAEGLRDAIVVRTDEPDKPLRIERVKREPKAAMTPPQPPEPLTPERYRQLAKRLRQVWISNIGDPNEVGGDHVAVREAADALDVLAKVLERCRNETYLGSQAHEVAYADGIDAERRAILALLVAAGQRQE